MFASTYSYEKTIHKFKYDKSSAADMHLKLLLMTVSTKLEPQLEKIILGKHQYQFSLRFIYGPHHARILQMSR
jgi:hypothetical protein